MSSAYQILTGAAFIVNLCSYLIPVHYKTSTHVVRSVFSSKIRKAWVYKVVHGWHNLMVGWWFLKEPFWVA